VYEGREGDLITGIVQQVDHRYSILDLGDAEALMPGSERIPYERLDRGNRVKALILEVRGETKGPQIVVSRSHPDFVRRLLELEVPELLDGTIEIKAIAREPGHRTKIAVQSNDPNVDPKGACVGARGSRVRQVVNELRGEKVDVVQWREDTAQFIAEALGPAKVKEVRIDEDEKEAVVIVNDHQLSLAIGREGQNARLAARLSGYRVDIRSESQESGELEEASEVAFVPVAPVPEAAVTEPDETIDAEILEEDAAIGEAAVSSAAAVEEAPETALEEEEEVTPVGEESMQAPDGGAETDVPGEAVAESESAEQSEFEEGSEQA
jgi:N utilization substance protein A